MKGQQNQRKGPGENYIPSCSIECIFRLCKLLGSLKFDWLSLSLHSDISPQEMQILLVLLCTNTVSLHCPGNTLSMYTRQQRTLFQQTIFNRCTLQTPKSGKAVHFIELPNSFRQGRIKIRCALLADLYCFANVLVMIIHLKLTCYYIEFNGYF